MTQQLELPIICLLNQTSTSSKVSLLQCVESSQVEIQVEVSETEMKSQYSMPTHHLVLFNTPVSGKLSPQKGISRISPYSKETQLPRLQRDAELNKALSTLSPPPKVQINAAKNKHIKLWSCSMKSIKASNQNKEKNENISLTESNSST